MNKHKPGDGTSLIHNEYSPPEGFVSLSTPIHHASTVVFDSVQSFQNRLENEDEGYSYGLIGTPTTMILAQQIADLEGGHKSVLTPSGLSAITLVYLSCLEQGDHVLVCDNIYSPSRELCTKLLKGFGIETTFYDPMIGGDIETLFRSNTKLVWTESPGSITLEVQDIPAIVSVAHRRGALVAIDNTWAAGVYFKPFEYDCDISVQAITKYISGHSDLFMGSITTQDNALHRKIKNMAITLGLSAAPDDCFLTLRGLTTLKTRLNQHEKSALEIARWLKQRPEVKKVLHPALEDCLGHTIWKRDFSGSSGLFSIILDERYPQDDVARMIDSLQYFKIGASWGGPVSLVLPLNPQRTRTATQWDPKGQLIRFSIGLEDTVDLISDLEEGLLHMSSTQ